MTNKEIGMRIKALLKQKGMTQVELSKKIGMTQSVVSEMISGKKKIFPLVEAVCELFGLSRDFVMTGVEHTSGDVIVKHDISENGLSLDDRVRLMEKIDDLYRRHQDLLKEAGDIMKEVLTINKLLVAGIN